MTRINRSAARLRRTVILGQGYASLPLAIRAADAVHQVIGFDIEEHRVKQLQAAESFTPRHYRRKARRIDAAIDAFAPDRIHGSAPSNRSD